MIALFFKIT